MNKLAALAVCASLLPSMSLTAGHYRVNLPSRESDAGLTALLVDRAGGGAVIDSVVVDGPAIVFEGEVTKPTLARVTVGGARRAQFVLEPGEIAIADGEAAGTPLNDAVKRFDVLTDSIETAYKAASGEEERKALLQQYNEAAEAFFTANAENVVGAMMFNSMAFDAPTATLDSLLTAHPLLKEYAMVGQAYDEAVKRDKTAEGAEMIDFEVVYNGKTQKLSDYVGKGRWTLVDFWASWCGPCRREIPNIKELLAQYGDKGLDVLGVAVWDRAADTENAIKQLGITWPVIVDAQSIPTELYGITGIPTIMLFDPQGRIVSRGKQGEELKAAVAAALDR